MPNVKRNLVVWFAAIVVAVNGFFPAVWILLTSFKTETELIQSPITYWPQAPSLANYDAAFTAQPILRFMLNSLVVASLSTLLCVLVGALAAYALTRLRMPQRNLIMSLLLAVAMFPLISLMVPLFKLMRELGLLNTYPALILPLRRIVVASVHAGDGELFPGHPSRPGSRGDGRRLCILIAMFQERVVGGLPQGGVKG